MRSSTWLASVFLLTLATPVLAAPATRIEQLAGPMDGSALGDVDGDGRLELAVLTRPGQASGSTISLRSAQGTLLWSKTSTVELVGSPLLADLDGDGQDEVAYCELSEAGFCKVLDARGNLRSEVGPFYFPGMTTSGPSAADVTGDGQLELVVATFGGLVAAYTGAGEEVWATDLWELHGEQIFGHPAIGDIDGDAELEIVVAGYNWGTVFALDGATGAIEWVSEDSTGRLFAYANGALLTDIDGSGTREVVLALTAADGGDAVLALDGRTGAQKGFLELPGAVLSFMTPIAADVDGNGRREVFLQGGDGLLRELALDPEALHVIRSFDLGAESWVAPAFVDLNQDGAFEIAAASVDELLFLDGKTFGIRDRYASALGGFMPTPVVGDGDRNGTLDVFSGSWFGETLERIEISSKSAATWRTLGGGPGRSGEQALTPPTPPTPPAPPPSPQADLEAVQDQLQALIDGGTLSRSVARALEGRILPRLESAEARLLRGDIDGSISRIEEAIRRLERDVRGFDSTQLRRGLAELTLDIAQVFRDRVAAFAGNAALAATDRALKQAKDSLAKQDFRAAADHAEDAADQARAVRDRVRTFVHGSCSAAPADPVLALECQLLELHLVLVGKSGALGRARSDLEAAVKDVADFDADSTLAHIEDAITELAREKNSRDQQAALAQTAERLTRLYLDEVTLAEANGARDLERAERAYRTGVSELSKKSHTKALDAFHDAAEFASP